MKNNNNNNKINFRVIKVNPERNNNPTIIHPIPVVSTRAVACCF